MPSKETSRRSFLTSVGVGIVGGAAAGVSEGASSRKEFIVAADESTPLSYLEEQVRTLHPEVDLVDRDETLEFTLASVPTSKETEFKSNVSGLTRYVERNGVMRAVGMTQQKVSDPRFSDQWAPQEINAPAAWAETQASGVTVAVVDTGVDYTHEDLSDRFGSTKGYDFVNGGDDPMDGNGHGTHVAGIAAGTTDNGTGIAGVSNAQLLGVKVLSDSGSGTWSDVAQGVRWAADNGADILNLSLGPPGCTDSVSNTVADAIRYAHDQGSLVVAAAGNDSCAIDGPALVDESVAVTALDQSGGIASFSNRGPNADVIAPGVSVLSSYPGDNYRNLRGTSMASPVVAGVAALALSSDSSLGPDALKRRVKDGAVDIGLSDEKQGAGRVDAENVVSGGGNSRPAARIDASTTTPGVGDAVDFDGSGSSDPDGSIATYQWDFGDSTTATGATVTHSYGTAGTYTVELTVTDDGGKTNTATTTVDVKTGGGSKQQVKVTLAVLDQQQQPVAGTPVELVDLSGDDVQRAETDKRGRVEFVEGVGPAPCNELRAKLPAFDRTVDLGCHNGGETVTETVQVDTGTGDQEVEVVLTVLDQQQQPRPGTAVELIDRSGDDVQRAETGKRGQVRFVEGVGPAPCNELRAKLPAFGRTVDLGCHNGGEIVTETVTVADNDAPSVAIDVWRPSRSRTVEPGDLVLLQAESKDPDGRIVDESWDWEGADPNVQGSFAYHRYDTPGTYDITLTATDDDGATATASVTVTVKDPNTPPTASIDVWRPSGSRTVEPGDLVLLQAEGNDPDGRIVDVAWDWEGADPNVQGSFAYHWYDTPGTYDVTATVTDDDGATATASVTIEVEQSKSCHARDPDCDGKFEDVDGDGDFDMEDVRVLFNRLDQYGTDPRFDFDGDGDVDIADVQALYNELR